MRITLCVFRIERGRHYFYTFYHQHSLEHMMNKLSRRRRSLFASLAFGAFVMAAQAQSWPAAKAITLVVGYPAGGSVDLVARVIAEPLGKRLNTQVIVENIGGAAVRLVRRRSSTPRLMATPCCWVQAAKCRLPAFTTPPSNTTVKLT